MVRLKFATWAPIVLSVALGVLMGVGTYTFSYAQGFSYFKRDPRACVNCHIMQREYDAWQKSSHHGHAVCIDCHLPHEFVPKYLAKTENGWRHGRMFTTQNFVEPIVVKPAGLRILQDNCLRCHGDLVARLQGEAHNVPGHDRESAGPPCLHCHSGVGHGSKAGLGGPFHESELDNERANERDVAAIHSESEKGP